MKARENPFRTSRVLGVRYRPQECSWDEILERFETLDRRGAIVGPHGSGKTTLLEDLEVRLCERGWETIRIRLDDLAPRFGAAGRRRLSERVGPRQVLLVDGAELMGRLEWLLLRPVRRRAGGIVITVHRPRFLRTLVTCETSAPLLHRLVTGILGREDEVTIEECRDLHERHGGNLRNALRELYDRYAALEARPAA